MPDVGQTEGRSEGRADGCVGKDVEAESSIALYPLRIQKWAGGDAQARAQEMTEEPSAGPWGQVADPRERGRMRIVPLIGAVEAIGAAWNRNHTPFLLVEPVKRLVYHILTASLSGKGGRHLARKQLELSHDVRVRHTGEEGAADQMGDAVLLDEAVDRANTLIGSADDEPVLHQPVQVGRDRGVKEGMAPAPGIFPAIRDHDVLLGELPGFSVRVGDDHISGQRPLRDRLVPAR